MKNTSKEINKEISEFYEYVNPDECTGVVSKLFFKYCADKSNDVNNNILTKEQINGIHEILSLFNYKSSKVKAKFINSILPLKNKINQRTGLNEIFFHSLSTHWKGEDFVELEEIRIIKDLFELLNNLERLRESEIIPEVPIEALQNLTNHCIKN